MVEKKNSIVIDLTYRCNATCEYCQWGSRAGSSRDDLPLDNILIPEESFRNMEITRVVFSGGEPLLHNQFEYITKYYHELGIEQLIVISNGLLLNRLKVQQIIEWGITGITVSLDSINPVVAKRVRGMSARQHQSIITNVETLSKYRETNTSFELGINVVLSSLNINLGDLTNFISFLNGLNLDFVKFQPIFNDGYAQKNAPHLLLNQKDASIISMAGEYICRTLIHSTNSIDFYKTISQLLRGATIDGASCGLDSTQSILIKEKYKFCFWINDPIYGDIGDLITPEQIESTRKEFSNKKQYCRTGMQCFCLQNIEHKWKVKDWIKLV